MLRLRSCGLSWGVSRGWFVSGAAYRCGVQLYIDESKSKAYIVVAVLVAPGEAAGLRKRMQNLRKSGQGHIHFVKEGHPRRKQILTELENMRIQAVVYRVKGLNPIAARALCITAILDDLLRVRATNLIFELEESALKSDEVLLRQGLLRRGLKSRVEYTHLGKSEEPILWVADAIAWSYARGDDYKRRAMKLITQVVEVSP